MAAPLADLPVPKRLLPDHVAGGGAALPTLYKCFFPSLGKEEIFSSVAIN